MAKPKRNEVPRVARRELTAQRRMSVNIIIVLRRNKFMSKRLLLILIPFIVPLLIDYTHYAFLKYIKQDKYIQDVKYNIYWWHYYFTKKYEGEHK